MKWEDRTIAIVAGDRREQEIARLAAATGAEVRAYGFPWPDEGIAGVTHAPSAAAALAGAEIALFPIPGIAPDGALFAPLCEERIIPDRAMLSAMKPNPNIILGWPDAKLKALCEELKIAYHEYEADRDLMLLRGPAIVEGMLRVIIENTDITIHKANIVMVGYGTIGELAARTLVTLGAHVTVAARNPVQRAAAYAAGAETMVLSGLADIIADTDILVNSVPVQLVTRAMLEQMPKRALLVDLAAPPGGIDRDAAEALGLRFVWARGLGSRAPVTVGRSQWTGIRPRIEKIFENRA
ncbi:MAG: dipicolinate synthase subunit DpsA [Proteobacteria bacterium]|nr:dipicolinate synthase subunit DpsA [Pseudomonadota bacterium]